MAKTADEIRGEILQRIGALEREAALLAGLARQLDGKHAVTPRKRRPRRVKGTAPKVPS